MVPDSAATASAMYTGQKTTFYTMGYNSSVVIGRPDSTGDAAALETVLDWAQQAGKKTGFVTTTRMSHATPAALYAKTPYR
jgi:alkaline phosphatase